MKPVIPLVFASFILTGLPAAAAETVAIAGLHPLRKVEAMCKFYGGQFTRTAKGHGCSRAGYGKVWCSINGKCVARLKAGFRLAQK